MNFYNHIFYLFILSYLFPIVITNDMSENLKQTENYNYEYPAIKKMSSAEKFFILLNDNIRIYESDLQSGYNVRNFTNEQNIESNIDNEKTVLSEFIHNNKSYILCLTKGKHLFIANESNIIHESQLNITSNNSIGYYYNLIPYKQNQFLISFISKEIAKENTTEKESFLYYYLRIKFFLYNLNDINNPQINDNMPTIYGLKYFTDYYLSCQITYDEKVVCFYKNSFANLTAALLNITDNNISKMRTINSSLKSPYFIKSCLSKDKKKSFISYKDKMNKTFYAIYDNEENTFEEMNDIQSFENCEKTDIQFFEEKNEYIFFCQNKNKDLFVLKINEDFTTIDKAKIPLSKCAEINSISIIYSQSIDYSLIYDCKYDSETQWNILIYKRIFSYDLNSFLEELTEGNINIEVIVENIKEIMNYVEIGENYEVKKEDFNLVIKPTNASYLEETTHANFTECENILREENNIDSSRIITFLQLEIKSNNDASLTNKVEYQAYDDQKNLLDLRNCKNIEMFYAIKDGSLNMSTISNFKDLGVDLFDIYDSFFNDICRPHSEGDNDVVLEDRIKNLYQNYSLCDEGCEYKGFNIKYKVISCDCQVKKNLSLEEESLNIQQFDEIEIESNFGLIKCYELVFSLEGKAKNIGFWIHFCITLIHIPLVIIICKNGIKPIEDFIIDEMTKHGYIKKKLSSKKLKRSTTNRKSKAHSPPPKYKENKTNNRNVKKKKIGDNSSVNKVKNSESDIIDFINPNKNNQSMINSKSKMGKKPKKKIKKKKNKTKKENFLLISKSKPKNSIKENIGVLPTQSIEKDKKIKKKINVKESNDGKTFNYILININLNNLKDDVPKNSYCILNNYTFEEAIRYDLRSTLEILYIYLLSKQEIFHAFLYRSPLESFPLRLCLLMFIFCSDLALNAIFYLDDKISEKYKSAKNMFLFAFSDNLTIILLSTLLGFVFMTLFTNLSNSTNDIREIFKNEETKLKKNKKYVVTEKRKNEITNEIKGILKKHKVKVTILLIIEISLVLFFWYYVTAFCHVYYKTQTSWLIDSLLSMLSRFFMVLILTLLFAKIYRMAVDSKIHCIYKIALFFYCFG